MKRPKYRRRELLPYPGAMRPMYYRRRVLQRLFTCPSERLRVAELLEGGAWPLSVRNGVPLFWYAVMGKDGLEWLHRSGLGAEELDRPATMPDGTRRTLFDQVILEPKSLRHFLGRGVGVRATFGKIPPGMGHTKPNKPGSLSNYEQIAAALLLIKNQLPEQDVVARLLKRDWPVVKSILEALTLGQQTHQTVGQGKISRL